MSDQKILRALEAQLATLSFTPQPHIVFNTGAWKDELGATKSAPYKPIKGQAFVDSSYRSDGNTPISTNPIQTRANRTYEVQCFADERSGEDEAYRLADAVSDHFFPANGLTNSLTSGSLTIQINRKPDKDPLVARPAGFVGVAVLIRCFALI